MGWFSKEEEPKVVHTSERRKCWASRDLFFQCLDAHQIDDPVKRDKEARKACPTELKSFEDACIATWVDYFKQKRAADLLRQQRIQQLEADGYRPMSEGLQITEVKDVRR